MSWLDELLKQTEGNEAPERYFWWSGLAAISAVTRKRIWISRQFYKLYPNIYVALISTKSGACKKGFPISLCKDLLQLSGAAKVISGCNSIQGILEELSNTGGGKGLPNGTVLEGAQATLMSEEFDSFLTDDPKSLTHLTALYDTHAHEHGWEKTLKSSQIKLGSPCITMLVASNEIMLGGVVKTKDFQGGFIGRTMMILENKSKGKKSLLRPVENKIDMPKLAERLKEVSRLNGEFTMTEDATNRLDRWYMDLEEPEDITGTYSRILDHIIKVAMLISLSRKDKLILEWGDISIAIDKCIECADTAVGMMLSTESPNGDKMNIVKQVLECICSSPTYSTTKMAMLFKLQRYQVSTTSVNQCIVDLISKGLVSASSVEGNGKNPNSKILYSLTEDGMNLFITEARRLRH